MADNRKQIMMGLASAAGAVAAFYGMRALMRQMKARSYNQELQTRTLHRLQSRTEHASFNPPGEEIPITGSAAMAELTRDITTPVQPVSLRQQVDRMAQYLISFNNMIDLLRQRRAEHPDKGPGIRSLEAPDRVRVMEVVNRLEADLPDYTEGNFEDGSLQERIYRLTAKVRDALLNSSHTDDDLFRLNGEMRPEVCRLLMEIKAAGEDAETYIDRLSMAFGCSED